MPAASNHSSPLSSPTRKLSHQTPTTNHTPIRQCNFVTPIEKSQNQLEGKAWEMAPTPPLLDQELLTKSPPTIPSPGLSHLLGDSTKRNATSPHMPRYRHVIPEQNGAQVFSPSKSPRNLTPKPKITFKDSNNFTMENGEESEPYDPLSKIEKLRRRLSLLKSQIKHSTQLLSDGSNLLTSPNKNKSLTPKKQSTPTKPSTSIFQQNHFQKNQDDDTFLLGKNVFTPSKSPKTLLNPQHDSSSDNNPSTPSRKMSALTLITGKKSPSSLRLSTPPTNINQPKLSPSSLKKRKINQMATTPKTPKPTISNKISPNPSKTPLSSHNNRTTPHSTKKKSPQTSKFNSDDIFTPIAKKVKKMAELDESFSLDLFKTPTPVKPKNPHSIKISAVIRRSLTQDEGEIISRNIFEEEEDDFVFKERKKR